ncbi:MAG: hypothetical protein M9962_05535 [Oligoflexia bacterium]|nr:hypothetical protein [Oligoflexia bacterium]
MDLLLESSLIKNTNNNMENKKLQEFLATKNYFRLGDLITEQPNPKSTNLKKIADENLEKAIDILKSIDSDALESIFERENEINELQESIGSTLKDGGNIYIYGCGATGRLSLSLERIWKSLYPEQSSKVLGFMSGGDLALVRSIENFEDFLEYGAQQLREIGFSKNDLLIAVTEGGETPTVIGATEEALKISNRNPYFIFCNPPDLLKQKVERSKKIIENKNVKKIYIPTGQMALSGSTRMQASTAQMYLVGLALYSEQAHWKEKYKDFCKFYKNLDLSFLTKFIDAESSLYRRGGICTYSTNEYAMTILTDTTERSPTFSLPGFENTREENTQTSLCHLAIENTYTADEAWLKLLGRNPIPLEWSKLNGVAGKFKLDGFDFSLKNIDRRASYKKEHEIFSIQETNEGIQFKFENFNHTLNTSGLSLLEKQLILKMTLNILSTLIMGKMGRYQSNIMTWVRPSNGKLIDRSIRYIQYLLLEEGISTYSYEQIASALFEKMNNSNSTESIVLNTLNSLKSNL